MAYYTGQCRLAELLDVLVDKIQQNGWTVLVRGADITPGMNGNSSTYSGMTGYAVASSSYFGNHYPYYAFDDYNTASTWAANGKTGWLRFDFGAGNEKTIVRYGISVGNAAEAPKNWTFEGSNDGNNWTVLDTRTDITNWKTGQNNTRYFTFNNTQSYRYYRLNVTDNNGGTYLRILQMEMMEDPTQSPKTKREYILISQGTSGSDNIVLVLQPFTLFEPQGNPFYILACENYDPNTYENFVNRATYNYYLSSDSNNYAHNTNAMVTYYLNVTPDRIFLATVLDPSVTTGGTNCLYAGLMKRYSQESDSTAYVIAFGMRGPSTQPLVMKNKAGRLWTAYTPIWINHSYAPSVWGDLVFLSPVFLEGAYEGMRGELDGIYVARTDNMVNEDEVIVGSNRYKTILPTVSGNNQFPTGCILMKMT